MPGAPPGLYARGISKRFAPALVLDDVALTLLPGEVHALLGQNGSGKSTLIKVLAGYHAPEPGGVLEVAGRRAPLPLASHHATALGVRFVHQELGLIPSLSVVENLLLDELATGGLRRISWRALRERARERLARRGLALEPETLVADLRPGERAELAIARAVDRRCAVLILDEATAFLPEQQRRELFGELHRLAAEGASVLLTTHDLSDVRAVADRVTVLREGRNVGTARTDAVGDEQLVEMVVGPGRPSGRPSALPKPGVASRDGVRGLTGRVVRDVSIDLPAGEVVGLAGLPASGHDEVPYLLFGARTGQGRLRLGTRDHDLAAMTPYGAVRAGIGLVPADRLGEGGAATLSVADNVMLPSRARAGRGLGGRRGSLADAEHLLVRHGVEPPDPELPFGALSGGNQQKALLAKWLHVGPALLLMDEPLRGIDLAVRDRVTATIRDAAQDGVRVVCAGSDHEQLASLCDRVLVFTRGTVAAVLTGDGITGSRIAALCHSGSQAASP